MHRLLIILSFIVTMGFQEWSAIQERKLCKSRAREFFISDSSFISIRNFRLSFMYGEHTDQSVIQRLQNAFDNSRPEQAEISLLKKNSEFN
jgi:hypothetical protein